MYSRHSCALETGLAVSANKFGLGVFPGGNPMKTSRAFGAVLAASLFGAATSAGAASIDASRQAVIDNLAGQLRQTISQVAAGSEAGVYEAQLALTLDQANVECAVAIAAVRETQGGKYAPPARTAIDALGRRVGRCGLRGTGALLGGGRVAFTSSAPLGGGGSNYQ